MSQLLRRITQALVVSIMFLSGHVAHAADLTVTTNTTLSTGSYTYDDVTVSNNATLTLEGTVHIVADNITVSSGSRITADKKGYAANSGPGAGAYVASGGSGAGHGGDGGRSIALPVAGKYYGSATHPVMMGSGGGGTGCTINSVAVNSGGKGGGGIWLEVENTLTVSGTISANGGDGSEFLCDAQSGGGAGGSIYIVTDTFAGAGDIVANGGQGGQTLLRGGGGGGGRIAIYYETSTFSGDVLAIAGFGKTESGVSGSGRDGTVGFFDTDGNDFATGHDWRFQFDDQPFAFDTITIDDGSQTTTEGTITLTGTQLIVDGISTLTLGADNSLVFHDVSVTGSSAIDGNIFLQANNLTIASGSEVSADGKGFTGERGVGAGLPGIGQGGGGGGYGGEGGTNVGGIEYGSPAAPVDLGSGGAGPGFSSGGVAFASSGGYGGGKIQLNISGTLTVNGDLKANGNNAFAQGSQAGGGSGGSIYVITEKFIGSGAITANGGNSGPTGGSGAGGGGAGGRIAIFHRQSETFSGTPVATGGDGVGEDGENGTVVLSQSVLAVSPDKGGDTGQVTVLISGSVFEEDSIVKLTKNGEEDIIGSFVKLENHGTTLKSRFNLTNAELGDWNVVIDGPNSTPVTLTDGFTVEIGNRDNLWVDIVGNPSLRVGRDQTYMIVYGNFGNNDVDFSWLALGLPPTLESTFDIEFGLLDDEETSSTTDPDAIDITIIDLPTIESGKVYSIPVKIKTAGTGLFTMRADITSEPNAYFDALLNLPDEVDIGVSSESNLDDPEGDLLTRTPEESASYLDSTINPPAGFILTWKFSREVPTTYPGLAPGFFAEGEHIAKSIGDSNSNGKAEIIEFWNFNGESVKLRTRELLDDDLVRKGYRGALRPPGYTTDHGESVQARATAIMELYGDPSDHQYKTAMCDEENNLPNADDGILKTNCLGMFHLLNPEFRALGLVSFDKIYAALSQKRPDDPNQDFQWFRYKLYGAAETLEGTKCGEAFKKIDQEVTKQVTGTQSTDPNAKYGPLGAGASRYISSAQEIGYLIVFENLESATAAAQEVIIEDELDTDDLDIDTFALGDITFGETRVTPPIGSKEFIAEVDLRPENELILRIEAGLDEGSGVITWKFISLDPATHKFTEDPDAGFLPPNDTSPEGEGSVYFSIKAKDSVSTEDEIVNSASIIFDTNEPIVTDEWNNAIDDTKPQSAMNSLESTGTLTSFDISWSGSDAHSGVNEYTVYVSENSGPFIEEITTTGTMTSFVGVNGSTYSFYTRARDNVGNLEDAPETPDETITIEDPMQEPCTVNTDYIVGVTCFGTTTVTNNSQLEDYLTDYDYNGSNYKNLYINYSPTMDNMDIHSPCEITVAANKTMTAERICVDGRKGIDTATGLTVNGTLVSFISELEDSSIGGTSTIAANSLLIQAYKSAEIHSSAVINVDGPILIKSIGNTSTSWAKMGQSSTINAESVRLEAVREASTGTGMQLTVENELEIISTGTESSSKALIGISSDIDVGSLEMSADKNVDVGNTSTIDIADDGTLTSTGSSSTSDVSIKLESVINADSLDLTAGDDAVMQTDSEVHITNNFHMQAATTNDCSISGSAVIDAGSESGNCL